MAVVLVTGVDGFTGSYVSTELCSAGHNVIGLGSRRSSGDHYYQANLLDKTALTEILERVNPDYIINLAAISYVAHEDRSEFYEVNVVGVRNLLEAALPLKRHLKRVLLVSSANVYGNAGSQAISEECPLRPMNDYAVSKVAMEYLSALYTDSLPITLVRPFNYTGIGQSRKFLIPKIVDHFRRRDPTMDVGNIQVSRDFSDVRSVARIYRLLLEQPELGSGPLNICTGHSYSLEEIVAICTELTGHNITLRTNEKLIRQNEIEQLLGDPSRLKALINPSKFLRISMRDTLRWMITS